MKKVIIVFMILSLVMPLVLIGCNSKTKIEAPIISIENDVVSWTDVVSAESYSLKIMFNDTDGYEIATPELSYKIRFVKQGTYSFCVRAKSNDVYSDYSDIVTYTLDKDINTSKSDDGKITFRGSGTQDDPILIENGAQLLAIKTGTKKETVNDVSQTVQMYYKQTCDIDFNSKEITPICTGSNRFSGYYDGNGFSIYNIKQTEIPQSGYVYMGLFGSIENASIINLSIVNYQASSTYISKGFSWGAIAGYSKKSNIENCHVSGSIIINSPTKDEFYGYAGLLVGESFGTRFERCSSSGEVNVKFSKTYCGGIVGSTNIPTIDTMNNCYSNAKVLTHSTIRLTQKSNVSSYAGGLIGYATHFKLVSNCIANGYVNATAVDGGNPLYIGKGLFGGGRSRESDGRSSLVYSNCYFNYQKAGYNLDEEFDTVEKLVNRYAIGGQTKTQNPSTTVFGFCDDEQSTADTFKHFDFENIWEITDGELSLRKNYTATHTFIE